MKKKVKICGKEYDVSTNALTPFLYKKEFKVGMMADIGRLQEIYVQQQGKTEEEVEKEVSETLMPKLDDFTEVIFRIAYILIKTSNRDFMPFDAWLESVDNFSFEDKWIAEVTELAVNSFLGQGTN